MVVPGQFMVCKENIDIKELILWKSFNEYQDNLDDVATAQVDDLFIVLDSIDNTINIFSDVEINCLTDEWKLGAYKVLSTKGAYGWVGKGWLMPLPP